MFLKPFVKMVAVASLVFTTINSQAVTVGIDETPDKIRFEQYTGAGASIVFWRLPTPGVSTFTGSSCSHLSIDPTKAEQASRFMALYLFAKTNVNNIFYNYDSVTCNIISFGMNG